MIQGDLREEDWKRFKVKLHGSDAFNTLEGVKGWDMERLENACKASWQLCQEECDELAYKLHEGSLRSMKQIEILKEQLGRKTDGLKVNDPDLVEVYEPLNHIDDVTRELVLKVAGAKLRVLLADNPDPSAPGPPPKLVEALVEAGEVDSGGWKERALDAEEKLKNARTVQEGLLQTLEESREQVGGLQAELADTQRELEKSRDRELALQTQVEELREELAAAQKEITSLQGEIETLQEEIERLYEEQKRLKNEIEKLKVELEAVKAQLAAAQEEIKNLQSRIAKMEAEFAETVAKLKATEAKLKTAEAKIVELKAECETYRINLKESEARCKDLQEKNEELQERLKKMQVPKKNIGVMTDVIGSTIDESIAQNEKFKNDIGELKDKLKDLAEELVDRGMGSVLGSIGLQKWVKPTSTGERLHKDAKKREKRMNKLKEEYAEKDYEKGRTKYALEGHELDDEIESESLPDDEDVPLEKKLEDTQASVGVFETEVASEMEEEPAQAYPASPPGKPTAGASPRVRRRARVGVLPSARGRQGPLPWPNRFDSYQRSLEGRRRDGDVELSGNMDIKLPKLGPLAECRKLCTKSEQGVTFLTVICSETDFRGLVPSGL